MTKKLLPTLAAIAILYGGCAKKEPRPPQPPASVFKENAVELVLYTKRLPDGRTVLALHKNFFIHHNEVDSTVIHDTLPDLGDETISVDQYDEDEDVTGQKQQQIHRQYDVLFKVDSLKQ